VASLLLKAARTLPPVVMEVNAANFSFADYPGSLAKKGYKVLQREVFRTTLGRQIAACAVLSEWHRDQVRRQLRLSESFPVEVIPEGADAPAPPPPRPDARRRLGIAFDGPVFLFFGMLRKDKGLETLLEAAARVPGEAFRLVIAGFPIDYRADEVGALVSRAGVRDRVLLRLGYVDPEEVAAYFGAADALVLPYAPSYRGGIGPLTKGACAYGRPVIGADVSGMGDFIARYQVGLVCRPGAPEALAGRLREFLALRGEERDAMGRRAAAFGRANTWEAMAARFSALFERLASQRRAARAARAPIG
jgi:UDP-glucose:(heptosyl)LPS alpha-1,3-glucosyltransferase